MELLHKTERPYISASLSSLCTLLSLWMGGQQNYMMQNMKMISGLLLVLFFNSCFSQDPDVKKRVCETCTDALACVSDDNIHYRCEQQDVTDSSIFKTPEHAHEDHIVVEDLDSFRVPITQFGKEAAQDPHAAYGFSITIPKIVCGIKFMDVGLELTEVGKAGLNVSTVRMTDPRCVKGLIVAGRKWFRVPRTEGSCGNTVKSNKTHVIYNNQLFMDPIATKRTEVLPLNLPYSCFYPLGTEAKLEVDAKPAMAAVHSGEHIMPMMVTAIGPAPRLTMFLYKTNSFEEKYPGGPQNLPLGLIMYVEVKVEDLQDKEIVVVLEDCFQTHTADFNDPESDAIITKKCAADFIRVAMLETAKSHHGRFSSLLATFPGKDHQIFLHCSISLCDTRRQKCKPSCSGRRFGRSAPSPAHAQVTMGPFTFE